MLEKPVRIGIDGREFASQRTGISRLLEGALVEISRSRPDWEMVFFGNSSTVFPEPIAKMKRICIPGKWTLWWDQVSLVQKLRHEKINLFLSPYYKIPLLAPCPVVSIVHDMIILTSARYRSAQYLLKRGVYFFLGVLYAHCADRVLTDSIYSQRCIQKYWGIQPSKIEVIYPGLSLPPENDDLFESLQQTHNFRPPYLLYVGNFKPHKCVDSLIQAYLLLSQPLKNQFTLLLVGAMSREGSRLAESVKQKGLSGRIVFTGHLPDEALATIYHHATLFVFPSSDEGFGLPPLEAMAHGVPVIASSAGAIPEVVGEGASLVPPENPKALSVEMERLLSDKDLRKKMAQRGKERSLAFSVASQAQKMIFVMENLLKKDGHVAS